MGKSAAPLKDVPRELIDPTSAAGRQAIIKQKTGMKKELSDMVQDLSGKVGYYAKVTKNYAAVDKDSIAGDGSIDIEGFKLACKNHVDAIRKLVQQLDQASPQQLAAINKDVAAMAEAVATTKVTYQTMENNLAFKVQEQSAQGRSDKLKIRHAKARITKHCTSSGFGAHYAKSLVEQAVSLVAAADAAATLRLEAAKAEAAAKKAKAAAEGGDVPTVEDPQAALDGLQPVMTLPETGSGAVPVKSQCDVPADNTWPNTVFAFDVRGCDGLKMAICVRNASPQSLPSSSSLPPSLPARSGFAWAPQWGGWGGWEGERPPVVELSGHPRGRGWWRDGAMYILGRIECT